MSRATAARYLSSWWLTAALTAGLIVPYVFFSFGDQPFAAWSAYILNTTAGSLSFFLLPCNIALASIRICYRSLRHIDPSPAFVKGMDIHAEIPGQDPAVISGLVRWLGENSFCGSPEGGRLFSVKGRLSFIPGTILRIGVIVLLVSMFISAKGRTSSERIFHALEGRSVLGQTVVLKAIEADLPEAFLQVGDETGFRLRSVRAVVAIDGENTDISAGFPAYASGLYLKITNLGYALDVAHASEGADIENTLDTDVLPPGREDRVDITSEDIFAVRLEPDRTIRKGLLTGRQFNLREPLFRFSPKGGTTQEQVVAGKGDLLPMNDGSLTIGDTGLHIRILGVRDPALPWVYAGVIITAFGALLMTTRFFWYRKEAAVAVSDRSVIIGYREEFFRRWGIQRFYNWEERLKDIAGPAEGNEERYGEE